jgi:hypothetical protein
MDFSFDTTLKTRTIFSQILEGLTIEQLNKIPAGFNNNIYWNIKHVVVTQQLLIYGLSSLPMLVTTEEVEDYKKGTKPTKVVAAPDINLLKEQLFFTLEKTKKDYSEGVFKNYTEYTVTTKSTLTNVKEAIEFNNFHEGIHLGYVLALKRLI